MESITFNQDTLAAMMRAGSDSKVEKLIQDVIAARGELARVKAVVELAEQAFKDTEPRDHLTMVLKSKS